MHVFRAGWGLVLGGAMISSAAMAQALAPLPEQPKSFDYPSVAVARENLSSRRDVTISNQAGWTIVEDASSSILWSFAPRSDPSYPSVVKRQVVTEDRHVVVRMNVLCEASKAACDNLVRQFNDLNAQMIASLQR